MTAPAGGLANDSALQAGAESERSMQIRLRYLKYLWIFLVKQDSWGVNADPSIPAQCLNHRLKNNPVRLKPNCLYFSLDVITTGNNFEVQGQLKNCSHRREYCKLLINEWTMGTAILIASATPEMQQHSSIAFCSKFMQMNCLPYWWELFSLRAGWNDSDVSSCFFLPVFPPPWSLDVCSHCFFFFPLRFLSVFQTKNLFLIFMCHVCLIKHTHWIIWLLCNIRVLLKWISHIKTCKVILK